MEEKEKQLANLRAKYPGIDFSDLDALKLTTEKELADLEEELEDLIKQAEEVIDPSTVQE